MSTKLICTAIVATSATAGIVLYYFYKRSLWKQAKEHKLKRIMAVLDADASCHIKDIALLREKLGAIIEGGSSKLQILTDFDKTLTKGFVEGKQAHSSFQVIECSSHTGKEEIAEQLKSLHAKYYPIEMSPTISTEEKTPLMIEWYKSSFDLGIKFGVRKSLLPAMIREALVELREGMDEFLKQVKKFDIPLLVVSAGLGDVIEEVFAQQVVLPPQVSILANYYEFGDNDGVTIGLKGTEIIHTFNKDKIFTLHRAYFDTHRRHTNAFVMGDTLGDPNMTDNIEYLKCLLKIGFLNANVEASLEKYLEVYDVVLTGDAPVDLITVLIPELLRE